MINKSNAIILASAVLAAAWLIIGPDLLQNWGLPPKAADILSLVPAMVLIFGSTHNKNFMRCEYKAWKKIFGK